jgi:CheY-like chemotaxis protein
MPGMNGVELASYIKENCSRKNVVIMISAAEWSDIEKEAKDAGIDTFMSKPLFPSLIGDKISEYIGADGEEKPNTQKETLSTFEGRVILLAEDVEINRVIVMALLESTLVEIDCAENGAEALMMFNEHPERYDLIFMDMQMPEMDGCEATRAIRNLNVPTAKSVPIIAMTANVFREDIERCLASGMNDHIGKPLDFEEVIETIRKYIPSN